MSMTDSCLQGSKPFDYTKLMHTSRHNRHVLLRFISCTWAEQHTHYAKGAKKLLNITTYHDDHTAIHAQRIELTPVFAPEHSC